MDNNNNSEHQSLIIPAIATLIGAYIVSKLAKWVIAESQKIRSFNGRPCEAPPMRPESWYTFGLAGQLRTIKSAQAQRLPARMTELCEELGDTWAYTLFGTRTIITRDHRNVQAMLATQFEDFTLSTDRDAMHQLLGTNAIFTQSGPAWKSSRALLKPAFDKASISDLDRLELFFQQFRDRIITTTSLDKSGSIELQSLLQKLTMDSSADFLLGSPVGALQESNNPSVNAASFTESFDIAQHVIVTRWLLNHLYWLYNPSHFRSACSVVHQQVQKFVQKALTKPKNENRYIFTEALAEATQDAKVIQDQVLSVMLAGRDTTASLLAWTILSLSRNPEVLKKLRAAVATAVGVGASAKIPTQEELRGITYLKWVLHEVLRLYPPVYANTRCAAKATTLPYGGGKEGQNPIALKKGERVVVSFFGLMRRKDLYGDDADEFRPERWGEENLRKIGWGWVPFNGGPRICLGQQMALTHASYFLVRILQSWENIEEVEEFRGKEIAYDTKITMYSGLGVNVKFT